MRRILSRLRMQPFFPSCVLCGQSASSNFCDACLADLPWNAVACQHCALPLPVAGLVTCNNCRSHPRTNLFSVSALRYEFPVDAMIKRFKYDEALHLARPLASLLVNGIRHCNFPLPDAIVTVPLHDNRLRERGFNQSQELAELVAGQLGLPLINAVQRIRDTPKQSDLGAAQRRKNLRHAFLVVKKTLPKRIAIVDDVMTTGSTVNALARQLHAHAVSEIQAWTIARVCHD